MPYRSNLYSFPRYWNVFDSPSFAVRPSRSTLTDFILFLFPSRITVLVYSVLPSYTSQPIHLTMTKKISSFPLCLSNCLAFSVICSNMSWTVSLLGSIIRRKSQSSIFQIFFILLVVLVTLSLILFEKYGRLGAELLTNTRPIHFRTMFWK